MLTKQQVIDQLRSGILTSGAFDGRDFGRLADWMEKDELELVGQQLKNPDDAWEARPWTEDSFRDQLAKDLDFGFEKALDRRGISASCMWWVIKLWLHILEVDLPEADESDYAQYGLPLLKATAVRFGLPNPIGDDRGDDSKYASE